MQWSASPASLPIIYPNQTWGSMPMYPYYMYGPYGYPAWGAPTLLLAILNLPDFTLQAHEDRCSFHLGVFQSIVFP